MTTQPRRRHGAAPGPAALIALTIALGLPTLWATTFGQSQTFRSSVDLVAVDVQVLTRDGRVVTTLTPSDFNVSIDGRRRKVVSAEFMRHAVTPVSGPSGAPAAPASVAPAAAATPGAPAGRTFVIAVDTASFRTADAHLAVLGAQRFLAQLQPEDRVGVVALPHGVRLSLSTDHVAARLALDEVVGTKRDLAGQFGMTVAEVVDITAAAASQSQTAIRETGSPLPESFGGPQASDDQMMTNEALGRFCSEAGGLQSPTRQACIEQALSEANAVAMTLEEDVIQRLDALHGVLRLLQETPGRKIVMVLSGGIPLSDRGNGRPNGDRELRRLGEQATLAGATIHTLYFDQQTSDTYSAGSGRSRVSAGRATAIYTKALGDFAEVSGGLFLQSPTGAAEAQIDRLVTDSSTYYMLGVEPDARDRDGKPHRLEVKVGGGSSVRARQSVVVPRLTK